MKVPSLGIIPARGGSKGVPRKNLRVLAGKPLIAWTIEAALNSNLSMVVVSSEDDEIISFSSTYGGIAPFVRPADLATDDAPTLPVAKHAIEHIEEKHGQVGSVLVLQPTTPLRTAEDINRGLALMRETECDSVVSVVNVGANHPFRMKRIVAGNRLVSFIDQGFEDMRPRQQLPPVYIREGSIYLAKRHLVMEEATLVGGDARGIVVDENDSVNIDTEQDFMRAETLMNIRHNRS